MPEKLKESALTDKRDMNLHLICRTCAKHCRDPVSGHCYMTSSVLYFTLAFLSTSSFCIPIRDLVLIRIGMEILA